MKNFKEIAEKCLAGELSGIFIFNIGAKLHSQYLKKSGSKNYFYLREFFIDKEGQVVTTGIKGVEIIDFIPDNMQEQIKIDIPEGKVPVMEQTENGVIITWKEKEITYADVISKLVLNQNAIYEFWSDKIHEGESAKFYKKVEVLRKLTNIRNYFGKPKHFCDGVVIKCVNSYCDVETGQFYFDKPDLDSLHEVVFAKREHAEQAIKMLGDELKYLFEPW